jgi:hypothetical protein
MSVAYCSLKPFPLNGGIFYHKMNILVKKFFRGLFNSDITRGIRGRTILPEEAGEEGE